MLRSALCLCGVCGPCVCGVRCSTLLTSWDISRSSDLSGGADLDFLGPIGFQPLEFDLENAIRVAGLDFLRVDAERQLNSPCKAAIGPLPAMPFDILLAKLGLPRAFQGQNLVLKADIDILAGDARQFSSDDDAVFTKPDVYRGKLASGDGVEPGEHPVHFVLHSPQFEKR